MSTHVFVEGLESRQLLSAAPVVFSATVARDRLEVKIDLLQFKADLLGSALKLAVDFRQIHKATLKGDTTLDASFAQLHTDAKMLGSELKNDRLAQQANALQDEGTIKLDILQIRRDKGNDLEIADHAKLMADRVQLQTDLLAGLDSRVTTRTSFETIISNDTQAIVTAAQGDTITTGAPFTDAVNKFAADRVTRLNTLNADLQTIAIARQKLANDLTAAQSS